MIQEKIKCRVGKTKDPNVHLISFETVNGHKGLPVPSSFVTITGGDLEQNTAHGEVLVYIANYEDGTYTVIIPLSQTEPLRNDINEVPESQLCLSQVV